MGVLSACVLPARVSSANYCFPQNHVILCILDISLLVSDLIPHTLFQFSVCILSALVCAFTQFPTSFESCFLLRFMSISLSCFLCCYICCVNVCFACLPTCRTFCMELVSFCAQGTGTKFFGEGWVFGMIRHGQL